MAGAFLLLWVKGDLQVKRLALLVTGLDLALAVKLLVDFDPTTHLMQFGEKVEWVPALGIHYTLGVDGISVLFVFLTAFLGWICILASWRAIRQNIKGFISALLVMQSLMLGVFCAMDLFLFFIFWEAMLIPMYLIIGIWGGKRVFMPHSSFSSIPWRAACSSWWGSLCSISRPGKASIYRP